MVDRVKNAVTNEALNYKQYARQSISKEHLMTQGAKDLFETGQINYIGKPGNKI